MWSSVALRLEIRSAKIRARRRRLFGHRKFDDEPTGRFRLPPDAIGILFKPGIEHSIPFLGVVTGTSELRANLIERNGQHVEITPLCSSALVSRTRHITGCALVGDAIPFRVRAKRSAHGFPEGVALNGLRSWRRPRSGARTRSRL